MADSHNLYIDQGADFSADIGIFDDSNMWNLSGYTGAAKLKSHTLVLHQHHLQFL